MTTGEAAEARIRGRAYEIWEREGWVDGRALEHWLQAEGEVAAQQERAGAAQPALDAAPTAEKGKRARITASAGKAKRAETTATEGKTKRAETTATEGKTKRAETTATEGKAKRAQATASAGKTKRAQATASAGKKKRAKPR
jgi:hypothetical protein